MIKIKFIFDSENLTNIGCKITSRGIKHFLTANIAESVDFVSAEQIFSIGKNLEKKFLFKLSKYIHPSLKYRLLYNYLAKTDLAKKMERDDLIVINGEGVLHHNRTTGLILITLGMIAKTIYDKKVVLLNFSIEKISPYFINNIISKFDLVITREKRSYRYLKKFIKKDNLLFSYDFAWIYLYDYYNDYMLKYSGRQGRKIIFSPGVKENKYLNNIKQFSDHDFLIVDNEDAKNSSYFKGIIDSRNVNVSERDNLISFMNKLLKYNLIISGRHHINIIAMYLGIPVHGISSNTPKVEATMEDVYSLHFGKDPDNKVDFVDFVLGKDIDLIVKNIKDLKYKILSIGA